MITDESIADFVAFTGASATEATQYLEMAGGDLQQAASLFMEMGGGGGGGGAVVDVPDVAMPPAGAAAGGGGGPEIDSDVAAEFAAVAAAAGIQADELGLPGSGAAMADVRAPIDAFQDQIIDPATSAQEQLRVQQAIAADTEAMERRMSFDKPEDPAPGAGAGVAAGASDAGSGSAAVAQPGQAINRLFAAPEMNSKGTFYGVIEQAKKEEKWILVNIQQAEVFASHQLNRDVWSDDTIKDIVGGSFLFWQRDDKSTEGEQFCRYYHCGHQLPHICIIDPRTGRQVKKWDGKKWLEAHVAAEFLFLFLDEFSLKRPAKMSPTGSPQMSPTLGPRDGVLPEGADVELSGLDEPSAGTGEAAPLEPVAELPAEPAEAEEHMKVSLRLPSGSRVTRRFLPGDCVEKLFAVASALSERPVSKIDISMQFPKKSLRDCGMEASLKDANVAGAQVLVHVKS